MRGEIERSAAVIMLFDDPEVVTDSLWLAQLECAVHANKKILLVADLRYDPPAWVRSKAHLVLRYHHENMGEIGATLREWLERNTDIAFVQGGATVPR
jgi:hypothetical protein